MNVNPYDFPPYVTYVDPVYVFYYILSYYTERSSILTIVGGVYCDNKQSKGRYVYPVKCDLLSVWYERETECIRSE